MKIHHPLLIPGIYFVFISLVSLIILRDAAPAYIAIDIISTSIFLSIPWLIYTAVRKIRTGSQKNIPNQTKEYPFATAYIRVLTLISAVSFLVMSVFVYEYGIRSPAKLPIYSIETSSGSKVTFVSMAHIGSESFYEQVQKRVSDTLSTTGGIVLYEGVVRTGTGDLEITKSLPEDLGEIYKEIALAGGLTSQTESNTLIDSDRTIRADTTLEQMDTRYRELRGSGSAVTPTVPLMSTTDRELIRSSLVPKSELHADLIALLIRSFLSFSIRELGGNGVETFAQGDPHLAQVVIQDRDQIVAQEITKRSNKNILVIYGALHIPSIISELQKNDPTIIPKYEDAIPLF